jgi:hypothetical protein
MLVGEGNTDAKPVRLCFAAYVVPVWSTTNTPCLAMFRQSQKGVSCREGSDVSCQVNTFVLTRAPPRKEVSQPLSLVL